MYISVPLKLHDIQCFKVQKPTIYFGMKGVGFSTEDKDGDILKMAAKETNIETDLED